MRKLKNAAHVYMVLGLVSGIFYREFTRFNHFTGKTQMSLVHTHLLALGMLAFLVVLALEKQFQLSKAKQFRYFFWLYNAGLVITVATMVVRGIAAVLGRDVPVPPYVPGCGHFLLMLGLIMLFVALGKRLDEEEKAASEPAKKPSSS